MVWTLSEFVHRQLRQLVEACITSRPDQRPDASQILKRSQAMNIRFNKSSDKSTTNKSIPDRWRGVHSVHQQQGNSLR